MMKVLFIFCVLLICGCVSFALPHTDSLMVELRQAIKDAHSYDENKIKEITKLKAELNEDLLTNLDKQYELNLLLYDQYKYYNYDSALVYARKLQQLANYKNSSSLVTDAKLKAIFIMLSSGLFKETFDSLGAVSVVNTDDEVKAEYYSLLGRAYYNLADFNSDPSYNVKANLYLDSALQLYPHKSFEFTYYSALFFLKKNNTDSAFLYLHTPNIDPESNYSNTAQGIEQAQVPYTRTLGLNLNVKF